MSTTTQTTATLEVGYAVALTLKADAAPSRAYVGRIEAIDERGVRLTLVDWLMGMFCGWDLFVPWEQIASALVATPDHDVKAFGDSAADWQTRMDGRGERMATTASNE